MYKPVRTLTCLLALCAGCTVTPRRSTDGRPPDWHQAQDNGRVPTAKPPSPPVATLPVTPAPTNPPSLKPELGPVIAPAPTVVRTSAPVRLSQTTPTPDLTWLSLNRWAFQRNFGTPRKLSAAPAATYAFSTTNGALVVQIGSQTAYWDRMEFRLGFAPRFIDDQVFIHNLDLKKNIEPLLRGLAVTPGNYRVIVVDPGHGGWNFGTKTADGHFEKEYTLDWARRLVPLLEQSGWQVWLTRTSDIDVPLQDRVAFADAHHADFFVSLHFNSPGETSTGTEIAGLETYCLTPVSMASTIKRDYPDDMAQFFPNNTFDEQNLQFAARLHRALLVVNGDADRGVRRARFLAVLRGQRRPAVLIEGGYLSNQREARKIADPAYRQSLAEAVAKALNGIAMKPAPPPKPEEKAPALVVDNGRIETNRLRPDNTPVKVESTNQVSEVAATNSVLRLMAAPPPRLHSPRNAP